MLKRIIEYLVNDLGITANVAVTIILSLLTFSFGFIITWIASAISKWKKRINYRKSLKILIRDFLASCEKQYLIMENFKDHKGFLYGEDYKISIKSNFSQNYLSSLDVSVFIENFSSTFKKSRASEISQIFEIVETVKTSKETFKEQISYYYSRYDEYFKLYNENLDNLRRIQDDLALEYNGKTVDERLASYIFSIFKTYSDWKQKGASTIINETFTEIVNPLFDTALKTAPNEISRKIIDYCLKCRLAVEEISNIEKHMKEEIDEVRKIHEVSFNNGIAIINNW